MNRYLLVMIVMGFSNFVKSQNYDSLTVLQKGVWELKEYDVYNCGNTPERLNINDKSLLIKLYFGSKHYVQTIDGVAINYGEWKILKNGRYQCTSKCINNWSLSRYSIWDEEGEIHSVFLENLDEIFTHPVKKDSTYFNGEWLYEEIKCSDINRAVYTKISETYSVVSVDSLVGKWTLPTMPFGYLKYNSSSCQIELSNDNSYSITGMKKKVFKGKWFVINDMLIMIPYDKKVFPLSFKLSDEGIRYLAPKYFYMYNVLKQQTSVLRRPLLIRSNE